MTAESKGPGANKPADNGKRIEPGQYPLWTYAPGRYATFGYSTSQDPDAQPKPCLGSKIPERVMIFLSIRAIKFWPALAVSIYASRCLTPKNKLTMLRVGGGLFPLSRI